MCYFLCKYCSEVKHTIVTQTVNNANINIAEKQILLGMVNVERTLTLVVFFVILLHKLSHAVDAAQFHGIV